MNYEDIWFGGVACAEKELGTSFAAKVRYNDIDK